MNIELQDYEKYSKFCWLIYPFLSFIVLLGRMFGGTIFHLIFFTIFIAKLYVFVLETNLNELKNQLVNNIKLTKSYDQFENCTWLNNIIHLVWLKLEPFVANEINVQLKETSKTYVDADVITLGTKQPYINKIDTLQTNDENLIVMDIDLAMTPTNLGIKECVDKPNAGKETNFKINVKKGIISIVSIENLAFETMFRIKLNLIDVMPIIQNIEISILNKITQDFVLSIMGIDITNTFMFRQGTQLLIDNILEKIVYDPFSYRHVLAPSTDLDDDLINEKPTPVANVTLNIINATLFTRQKEMLEKIGSLSNLKNTPNFKIYLKIEYENFEIETVSKNLTMSPAWNEVIDVPIFYDNNVITCSLYTENKLRKDELLGKTNLNIEKLKNNNVLTNKLVKKDEVIGEINIASSYIKILESTEKESSITSGIFRLTIKQLNLSPTLKHSKNSKINIETFVNSKHINTSKNTYQSKINKIKINEEIDIILHNLEKRFVVIKIHLQNKLVIFGIDIKELVEKVNLTQNWFKSDSGDAEIKLDYKMFKFEPTTESTQNTSPLGVLKLTFIGCKSLKGGELISKPEPYLKIYNKETLLLKTEYKDNTKDPVYNEIIYVPIFNVFEMFEVEVWHYNSVQKDKILGKTEISIAQYLQNCLSSERVDSNFFTKKLKIVDKETGSLNAKMDFIKCNPINPKKGEIKTESYSNNGIIRIGLIGLVLSALNTTNKIIQLKESDTTYIYFIIFQNNTKIKESLKHLVLSPNIHVNEKIDVFVKELDIENISIMVYTQNKHLKYMVGKIDLKTIDISKNPDINTYEINQDTKANIKFEVFKTNLNLDTKESIKDKGILNITLSDCKNLIAADKNGTSDPYVIFKINDTKVYKSKIIQKNLNPTFNEQFSHTIDSLSSSIMEIEVFDHNKIMKGSSLGTQKIILNTLKVSKKEKYNLKLQNVQSGEINITLEYIVPSIDPAYINTKKLCISQLLIKNVDELITKFNLQKSTKVCLEITMNSVVINKTSLIPLTSTQLVWEENINIQLKITDSLLFYLLNNENSLKITGCVFSLMEYPELLNTSKLSEIELVLENTDTTLDLKFKEAIISSDSRNSIDPINTNESNENSEINENITATTNESDSKSVKKKKSVFSSLRNKIKKRL